VRRWPPWGASRGSPSSPRSDGGQLGGAVEAVGRAADVDGATLVDGTRLVEEEARALVDGDVLLRGAVVVVTPPVVLGGRVVSLGVPDAVLGALVDAGARVVVAGAAVDGTAPLGRSLWLT
jgi:hypothetical protein